MNNNEIKVCNNSNQDNVYQHNFFHTTSVQDFQVKNVGFPPSHYPQQKVLDNYCKYPFAPEYQERKNAFLDHCLKTPAGDTIKGYYVELARLYRNEGPVYEGAIRGALNYIDDRNDCADFVLLGIIRILYQFKNSELLSRELIEEAEETVLNFKYWPDEPGIDSMCTWTENHQIMFAVNDYLAGQMFPEKVFSNSEMSGLAKMERARRRITKWLEMRYHTGFSEWLSHIYYDEDITALLNLLDFAHDPVLETWGKIVLDTILLDMALNSFYGVFGSTHGRSYAREKRNANYESTTDTAKLVFGMGRFSFADNMSAVTMAVSEKYEPPQAICNIAGDYNRPEIINRQRMGISIKEARRWGLNYDDIESGMVFLSLEAYAHPLTIETFFNMMDRFNWWDNQFFSDFKKNKNLINLGRRTGTMKAIARYYERDITRNTREEVNIYTYRTPDYMMSCAQDYRRGYGGDQQHIWQATLSPEAVCFTTHPGSWENTSTGYWVGSGSLPRVAQIKNVLFAIYNISDKPGLYKTNSLFFTHAWFPRDKFDEIVEEAGWIFGRKGDGYIAIFSQNGYEWQERGEDQMREVIAEGKRNIWICEMGRRETDGDFARFIDKISEAMILFNGLMRVKYESPSQGELDFGWYGLPRVNGKMVRINNYPRYDNPYLQAGFPPEDITITSGGGHSLLLNLEKCIRVCD